MNLRLASDVPVVARIIPESGMVVLVYIAVVLSDVLMREKLWLSMTM